MVLGGSEDCGKRRGALKVMVGVGRCLRAVCCGVGDTR